MCEAAPPRRGDPNQGWLRTTKENKEMPNLGCLNSYENTGVRQSWILKFENIHEHRYLIFQLVNQGSHIWESHIWELDRTRLYETAVCCRNKALVVIGQATGLCWKNGSPFGRKQCFGSSIFRDTHVLKITKNIAIINLNWMNYVLSSREDSNLYINSQHMLFC